MPGLTDGLGGSVGGSQVFYNTYQRVAYRTLSDLGTSARWIDESVTYKPQKVEYPAPRAGQSIEIDGIACIVVFGDEETVFVSPLGVPKYFGVARRWIAGRWKEREVVHA